MQSKLSIQMRGGLGNQLFIYSAGTYFANSIGAQPRFFMRGISRNSGSLEGFLPGAFVNNTRAYERLQTFYELDIRQRYSQNCLREIQGLKPSGYAVKKNSLVVGFFQNREFPLALEKQGFDFSLDTWPISDWAQGVINQIKNRDSALVHIRRGDYKNHSNSLGLLSDYYFEKALELIRPGKVFIVSDSPDDLFKAGTPLWARDAEVIFTPPDIPDIEILKILTHAPNLVMSNSSFSWWGAYLSTTSGITIAPRTWFRGELENQKVPNIHLPHWELIESEWVD